MIFKDKKIKELEKQLENPNLTDEDRTALEKQLATLQSEKSSHWGWIIVIVAIFLIFIFSKFIGFFVNSKKITVKKNNKKIEKPVRYNAKDFITAPTKKKHRKAAYSNLAGEINVLKNKLKNQRVTRFNPSNAAGAVSSAAGSHSISVFVNPKYLQKIKVSEGYKSPVQLANAALKYPGANGVYNPYAKTANGARTNILVPEGTVVSAYTKYKLYSYNTSVPVIAVVSAPYSFKGKVVIPAGYEFMGSVAGHTKSRLDIKFTQIINPTNGESLSVNAVAVMENGSAGITGNAHYHVIKNVLAGIGSGILGAAAMFAGGGSAVNSTGAYTYQDTLRQNVAQNEISYAQNSLNNAQQSANQVVITLPAKTPIKIMFLKPLTGK
ncbi:MAG: hypothetical protein EVJ46_06315 [Candidatus Acididesulfobacter guangdongensis]|jgi:hypothetical protein|uniref:TrbI/VirB10 family protein n=1 Tax=Acididesulfobacter guangdongensis TaxID=2597225 RepID=A0A519BH72_ACIG2|nr:MAG: hypothetical protein EVJ46_06315 [Candidatus Acididesulfobacter guangdongensis]